MRNADVEISFWEHGFLGGQVITDQFQSAGVSFSGQMRWISRIKKRRGARGATLANFNRDQRIDAANPFSVKFDYLVNDVTFGLAARNAVTRVTALLRGRQVGFFETTVNEDRIDDNIFGFTDLRLDEILIDFGDSHYATSFDTLHFNHALNQRGEMIESGVEAVRYRTIFNQPDPEEEETGAGGTLSSGGSGNAGQVESVTAVPLPAAFWMLLLAIGGTAAGLRRSRR